MKRITVFLTMCLVATMALVASPGAVSSAQTPTPGGVTLGPVEYVAYIPFDNSTSTGVSIHKNYMYLTSWKAISIYDISDPENPTQTDSLPVGFMFENEDVEITPDANYLFFSETLPDQQLHVYDIEDKTNIQLVTTVEGAGDHTFTCLLKCKWGYGSEGTIINLADPADPKMVAAQGSEGSWHTKIGLAGGAHDVTEVKPGFAIISTLSGPLMYIDATDPVNPKVLGLGEKPTEAYLFHSGEWPNAGTDRWMLMQGEQNFQPRCDPEANGPFLVYDTQGWQNTRTFKLSDEYAVQNGTFTDGNPPANGLGCSAHWFESHPTFDNGGIVAMGYYEHGTRFFNITSKGKIQEAGVFLPYAGSTSAAYWASKSPKNDLVYAVDYTRGIDVLRYTGKAIDGGGGGGGGGCSDKRPYVKMAAKPYRPVRGSNFNFVVRLAACERSNLNPAGTKIILKRKKDRKYVNVAQKTFDKSCRVVFPRKADFKSAKFRAFWPKQREGYTAGRSQEIVVNTRGG
ncbi:MAG TPA: hypothetical protein VEU29_08325 [Actinomycetota bacterium]|nr:hypothetical protein [Actinomycetota bacterium]